MSVFILVGHDCPYGEYPAPVIPVGHLDGRLVTIYPGGADGPSVEPLDEDALYVLHDEILRDSLRDFDYRLHRLFAQSRGEVWFYPVNQERQFLDHFLSAPEAESCSAGLRSMLADGVRRETLEPSRMKTRG
jgi:hypothetical protein